MDARAEDDDLELLVQVRAGDRDAFLRMYLRHHAALYRFGRLMLGHAELAEDVVQEVFVAVVQGLPRFDAGVGTVSAYLFGMTRNVCRRHVRSRHRTVPLDTTSARRTSLLTAPSEPIDAAADVRLALQGLPRKYREILVLCDVQEYTYAQAAAVLGCAIGTVRSRLHRARGLLVARLTAMRDTRPPMPATLNPAKVV